jgi:uncharacterized protein (DUF849 family)
MPRSPSPWQSQALSHARQTIRRCRVLPTEQIEPTHAAYEADAALVHIQVRNDDESASSDPDRLPRYKRASANTAQA